jgi:hypothetical protein
MPRAHLSQARRTFLANDGCCYMYTACACSYIQCQNEDLKSWKTKKYCIYTHFFKELNLHLWARSWKCPHRTLEDTYTHTHAHTSFAWYNTFQNHLNGIIRHFACTHHQPSVAHSAVSDFPAHRPSWPCLPACVFVCTRVLHVLFYLWKNVVKCGTEACV